MPWADADRFWELYRSEGPRAAADWLHGESEARGLLHGDGTSSGVHWSHDSSWGPVLITVNEAKPEKDPRDIAAAAGAPGEPAAQGEGNAQAMPHGVQEEGSGGCVFCWDSPNEVRHLRIPLKLDGREFSLHFSPYAYFPEHCIVATREHIPQRIDKRTFADLLDLCDLFPHYFFGANADLPVVGGSILAHHHYQGGNFEFPLDNAPVQMDLASAGEAPGGLSSAVAYGPSEEPSPAAADAPRKARPGESPRGLYLALGQVARRLQDTPEVAAGLVRWPLTVIRLESADRGQLLDAADSVLQWWRGYSNPDIGVAAADADGVPHNTITPIARKMGDVYRLDLVLRCNIVSDEHPLGVFHPHEEVHCVKKENIGLIEAMGLAILPPRVRENFDVASADSPDRQRVGDLFTLGLEQCGVLPNRAMP